MSPVDDVDFRTRKDRKLGEEASHRGAELAGETTNRHLYAPPISNARGHTTSDCDQDDALELCPWFLGESWGCIGRRGGNNIVVGDLDVGAFESFEPILMTFHSHAMRALGRRDSGGVGPY